MLRLFGGEDLLAPELPAQRVSGALEPRGHAEIFKRATLSEPCLMQLRGDRVSHSGLTAQYAATRQDGTEEAMRCVQSKAALALPLMSGKNGPRGRRSPCPEWWVEEANARMKRRGITRKQLARALSRNPFPISEMMIIRCLHSDPEERVPTIEALEAISDALGIPRPVIVANTLAQALELQAAVSFDAIDAERLRIKSEIERAEDLQPVPGSVVDGRDGRTTRHVGKVDVGRARAAVPRSPAVRRTPRSR